MAEHPFFVDLYNSMGGDCGLLPPEFAFPTEIPSRIQYSKDYMLKVHLFCNFSRYLNILVFQISLHAIFDSQI